MNRSASPIRAFVLALVLFSGLLSCVSAAMNGWLARWIVQAQEATYRPVDPRYKTTGPAR